MKDYDLIVLGTGTGGGTVARACVERGWTVLNVENRTPGGTCAQRGCDAKKPFVEAAAAVDLFARLQGKGLKGMEFAHVAARLQRHVRIAQRSDRALKAFDGDLVQMLVKASRSLGIRFRFGSALERVERSCTGLMATCGSDGRTFDTDLAVHGAGRVPSTIDLAAGKGGIALADNGGVAVNEFMQSTSNPDVYAVGDCSASAGKPLTPVANLEADVVSRNLLHGNSAKPDYRGVASVVFTSPQLAMAGLTEQQAAEDGLNVEVRFEEFASRKTMRQLGVQAAAGKVLLAKTGGKIVGGHFLGPGAADMANCVAIAIRNGLTAKQLADTVYAYPTLTGMIASLFITVIS